MNKGIFASCGLVIATLGLAACDGGSAPVEDAAPAGIEGLTVTDGKLVLNAVDGNPAAVYFTLAYDGSRGLAVRKASVEGAESSMLHEFGDNMGHHEMMEALPMTLQKGDKLVFEPGSRHVMVFGLSPDIKPGDTTNVTLTVSGGQTATFPVTVVTAKEFAASQDDKEG